MARIENYPVFNFSGGVRRDKGPMEMQKNELLDARNVEIDELGRIKVRRGSYQVGNTTSGTIENSFLFTRTSDAGAGFVSTFLRNTNASTGVLEIFRTTRLNAAVATSDTTITVISTTNFAASGTIEIEGDLIAYTGVTATTFTGCSTITSAHATGAAVNQWRTLTQSGTAVDASSGVYYFVLNNILYINGRRNWKKINNNDGETISNAANFTNSLFGTVYRDRVYAAGDGSGSSTAFPFVVSYSARGTGDSGWTDNFNVEDQRGEPITGFRVHEDRLWIMKINSMFSYDEIELKIRQNTVGAYNHKVVQQIDGLMFTFCPEGIFKGNGFSMKQIGNPVRQYWQNFKPILDANGRTVTNTFAGRYRHNYILYIHNITDPETINDVVLVYNTIRDAWVVWTGGFTSFQHFSSLDKFRFGDSQNQFFPALFGHNNGGQTFRFFESRYVDGQTTPVVQGTDVFQDLFSDTGSPVSAFIETPLYDLTHPELYKEYRNLRVYSEQGNWMVDYRVENELGIGPYRTLGKTSSTNSVLPFPSVATGWRIGLRISSAEINHAPILNGFTFEDTEVTKRQ